MGLAAGGQQHASRFVGVTVAANSGEPDDDRADGPDDDRMLADKTRYVPRDLVDAWRGFHLFVGNARQPLNLERQFARRGVRAGHTGRQ